jgi:hypothetical protein
MSAEKSKNLLEQIIDGAIEAVKKPFTIKRVTRAFESAKDSLDEQLLSTEAEQTTAREALVNAAKNGTNLQSYIQQLIDLQLKVDSLNEAKKALVKEESTLLK